MGIRDVNVVLNLEKSEYGMGIRCFQCGSFNIIEVLLTKTATEQKRLIIKEIDKLIDKIARSYPNYPKYNKNNPRIKILEELKKSLGVSLIAGKWYEQHAAGAGAD